MCKARFIRPCPSSPAFEALYCPCHIAPALAAEAGRCRPRVKVRTIPFSTNEKKMGKQESPDRVAFFQVHTPDRDRVYQCPQCDKGFKEHRTLKLHLKIHNAEYPEQCGVCAKVFRTKWQLKQHQMDHGGERPYPCPECSFTCKTKQQLNEHRRKHSVRRQHLKKSRALEARALKLFILHYTDGTAPKRSCGQSA